MIWHFKMWDTLGFYSRQAFNYIESMVIIRVPLVYPVKGRTIEFLQDQLPLYKSFIAVVSENIAQ